MIPMLQPIKYIREKNEILIINQTKLPSKLDYKTLFSLEDVWKAIKNLEVRGAPLIGVVAAYGLAIDAQCYNTSSYDIFIGKLEKAIKYLQSSRPTAVNLENAMSKVWRFLINLNTNDVISLKNAIIYIAENIQSEDYYICKSIGEYGANLLKNDSINSVLTYCNAGALATSNCYGTALAPVYKAIEQGKDVEVFACETRPILQGARLTTFELTYNNVKTTLITDNMVGWLMQHKKIDAIFVGCDRVAINGDFANKIGTNVLAIMAKYHRIPFYVCMPSTTIDFTAVSSKSFIIEQRSTDEVKKLWYEKEMVSDRANILNPAFDCTGTDFVTGYITEKGVLHPPFVKEDFYNEFG